MVIPWVKIVWINDHKGYGLVAARPIPKGTISFVQDGLDIVIAGSDLQGLDPVLLEQVEKYSYEDFLGNRIVSWDFGKYMNHDDDANTLTTGYGFEVATRDIAEGEEVTDDYRIFSTHHDTTFQTKDKITADFQPWPEELIQHWDERVLSALLCANSVEQPLSGFIQSDLWQEVLKLHKNPQDYRSVSSALPLRYKLMTGGLAQKRVAR